MERDTTVYGGKDAPRRRPRKRRRVDNVFAPLVRLAQSKPITPASADDFLLSLDLSPGDCVGPKLAAQVRILSGWVARSLEVVLQRAAVEQGDPDSEPTPTVRECVGKHALCSACTQLWSKWWVFEATGGTAAASGPAITPYGTINTEHRAAAAVPLYSWVSPFGLDGKSEGEGSTNEGSVGEGSAGEGSADEGSAGEESADEATIDDNSAEGTG